MNSFAQRKGSLLSAASSSDGGARSESERADELGLARSVARPLLREEETRKRSLLNGPHGSLFDPGCVKTPKGRSRRGIVFYRRRGFRVVLQPLATTLVLEK